MTLDPIESLDQALRPACRRFELGNDLLFDFDLRSTGNLLLAGNSLIVTGNGTLVVHKNGKKLGRNFK